MKYFHICFLWATIAAAAPVPVLDDVIPLIRDDQWTKAAPLLETIVAENRFDGVACFYLGAGYLELDRYDDALSALQRAIQLGVNGGWSGMRQAEILSAECLAKRGDPDGAIDHIARAWSEWGLDDVAALLEQEEFSSLREHPRALELAGHTAEAEAGDRSARWRADLAYFVRLLQEVHPEPFHSCNEQLWREKVRQIEASIPNRSDLELSSALMQLAAKIGDGHTAVYPPGDGEMSWNMVAFFPLWFRDGWYVAAAAPGHESIVGGRILGAGNVPQEKIYEVAMNHLASDNEMTPRWLSAVALQFAEIYELAGAMERGKPLRLQLELADGQQVEELFEPLPIDRNPNSRWAPADWPDMPDEVPLYLQYVDSPFHLRQIQETDIIYAQLNQTINGEDATMTDYGHRIHSLMKEVDGTHLILDLRWNNGGNAFHARGFVDQLLAIEELRAEGSLYLLMGPRTFSATAYLIGMIERHRNPIFVGMPSGCRPVGYSSERSFRLPYSGLTGSISRELRIDGDSMDDRRPWYAPTYVAWPDGADLRAGRDPVLEQALRVISSSER